MPTGIVICAGGTLVGFCLIKMFKPTLPPPPPSTPSNTDLGNRFVASPNFNARSRESISDSIPHYRVSGVGARNHIEVEG